MDRNRLIFTRFLVYKHHLMIANWSAVWSYDVKFAGLFKIASSRGDALVYDNSNSFKKATFS